MELPLVRNQVRGNQPPLDASPFPHHGITAIDLEQSFKAALVKLGTVILQHG